MAAARLQPAALQLARRGAAAPAAPATALACHTSRPGPQPAAPLHMVAVWAPAQLTLMAVTARPLQPAGPRGRAVPPGSMQQAAEAEAEAGAGSSNNRRPGSSRSSSRPRNWALSACQLSRRPHRQQRLSWIQQPPAAAVQRPHRSQHQRQRCRRRRMLRQPQRLWLPTLNPGLAAVRRQPLGMT